MTVYECKTRHYDSESQKYFTINHFIIAENCYEASAKLQGRMKEVDQEFNSTTIEYSIRRGEKYSNES